MSNASENIITTRNMGPWCTKYGGGGGKLYTLSLDLIGKDQLECSGSAVAVAGDDLVSSSLSLIDFRHPEASTAYLYSSTMF